MGEVPAAAEAVVTAAAAVAAVVAAVVVVVVVAVAVAVAAAAARASSPAAEAAAARLAAEARAAAPDAPVPHRLQQQQQRRCRGRDAAAYHGCPGGFGGSNWAEAFEPAEDEAEEPVTLPLPPEGCGASGGGSCFGGTRERGWKESRREFTECLWTVSGAARVGVCTGGGGDAGAASSSSVASVLAVPSVRLRRQSAHGRHRHPCKYRSSSVSSVAEVAELGRAWPRIKI